jgi:hypothetical protein
MEDVQKPRKPITQMFADVDASGLPGGKSISEIIEAWVTIRPLPVAVLSVGATVQNGKRNRS